VTTAARAYFIDILRVFEGQFLHDAVGSDAGTRTDTIENANQAGSGLFSYLDDFRCATTNLPAGGHHG
jgi:hypothetical protein